MIQFILSAFLALASAESIALTQFGGLNDQADPVTINQGQAQSLLNVELNRSGNSVRKRDGYASYLAGYSTVSVSSLFAFKNQAGNEIMLFTNGSDVWRSANSGTPTVLTTVTYQARLYCQNADGVAYCFTSANDDPWKYDGTTRTHLQALEYPNGKFSTFTQDRQLVAGATDYPNRLYVSKSGAYTDFRGGNDVISSWYEDIGSNGDKITFLAYLNGRTIVGKEYSIVGFNLTNQFDSIMYSISSDVGTPGPESVVQRDGLLYFKGHDNEFYVIDSSPGGIKKISLAISSTTANLLGGKNRQVVLTDKADWDGGDFLVAGPGAPLASNIVFGSVVPSSWTAIDTSSADFNLGRSTGDLSAMSSIAGDVGFTCVTSTYSVVYNADALPDAAPYYWTLTTGGGATAAVSESTLTVTAAAGQSATYSSPVLATANGASTLLVFRAKSVGCGGQGCTPSVQLWRGASNGVPASVSLYPDSGKIEYGYGSRILASETAANPANSFSTFTVIVTTVPSVYFWRNGIFKASSTITGELSAGQFPDYVLMTSRGSAGQTSPMYFWTKFIYVATGTAIPTSINIPAVSTFTSRIFDTGFSTPTMGRVVFSSTTPSGTSIAYSVRSSTSPNNDLWGSFEGLGSYGRPTTIRSRYLQYQASMTHLNLVSSPGIHRVDLAALTTGQYITPCVQPGPAISAWGTINAAASIDQTSGISYSMATGDDCSNLGAYATISTGTAPGVAVKAALKIKTTFSVPSATNTARLDSITVNWSNGAVSSPTFGAYWNDGLYWSVQIATGGNDRVLKYDLLHNEWFVFDIHANHLLTYNNSLYFGGSTIPGKVYKFSDAQARIAPTSDDGTAINSHWRSKNFAGSDPFSEAQWNAVSSVLKKQDGGTASLTWRANGGDTGSGTYSVSLSTGTNAVRSNYRIPVGTRGTFFSVEVGNNSTIPWELLGVRIDLEPRPWRPLP